MNSQPTETNDITELRALLFDSMRSLKKGASADDIALAKAKSEIAQTIINSAKVEVDYIRASGGDNQGTGFIAEKPAANKKQPPSPAGISHPTPGVIRHIMK
ncbi:MAG: hypothetical protein Q7U37_03115 [Gallionella sp.]|nr:hypothetical protein [Gallionella sp.]